MAIVDRFGNGVRITAYCGKHEIPGTKAQCVLIRSVDLEGMEWHYFARSLKATGGPQEIDAAVDAAPEITLDAPTLKRAIAQAE